MKNAVTAMKMGAFDYLTKLQQHTAEVAKDPAKWMPWNYREALEPAPG